MASTGFLAMQALFASFLFLQMANAEDPDSSDVPKDVKGFAVKYKGTRDLVADSAMSSRSLGGCRSLETHSDAMMKHFESWGVDLNSRKDKLYDTIQDRDLSLWPLIRDQKSTATISDMMDLNHENKVPVEYMQWFLMSKTKFEGPRGILAKGSHLQYGLFRFENGGQEHCIEFYSRSPQILNSFDLPVDYVLNHEEWGEGEAKGNIALSKPMGSEIDMAFTMTFSNRKL